MKKYLSKLFQETFAQGTKYFQLDSGQGRKFSLDWQQKSQIKINRGKWNDHKPWQDFVAILLSEQV